MVGPMASSTSTDRERESAGGMSAQDATGSSGGVARSFGRGSSYRETATRLLLPRSATKPFDQKRQEMTPCSSAPCIILITIEPYDSMRGNLHVR
jgi:hypothetical protein